MIALRQTLAILIDAYRELNARKLFWITMGLSALIVAAFACVGINEKGLTVLWCEFPIQLMAELYQNGIIDKGLFYKFIFFTVGYNLWLTWAATILALVSTAGIMPEFVTGGSIELSLSRPIGRLRLFLTKYASGLLFVGLQVAVFTGLSFLVIGLRGGGWAWSMWWGVPLVLAFFSFLYCVMVLIGLLTRSTMASLLTACVFWLLVWGLHVSESGIYLQLTTREEIKLSLQQSRLTQLQGDIAKLAAEAAAPADTPKSDDKAPAADTPPTAPATSPKLERLRDQEKVWTERIAESQKSLKTYTTVHSILFAVKTLLPKTSETMELLQHRLISGEQMERFITRGEAAGGVQFDDNDGGVRIPGRQVRAELDKVLRSRSTAWVLGTSLVFEAVIVGAACIIFCRRDF